MSTLLRRGSRGPTVSDLQGKLNTKLRPSHNLATDGIFGPRTEAAVRAFQSQARLMADGIAGPQTNAALAAGGGGGGPAPNPEILHRVNFIPQPTPTSCWAASTAMMTNSVVPAVIARTPPAMIRPDGALRNSSGSDQAVVTGTAYGNAHGLRCHAPMSWTLAALTDTLRRSPLMFDMLWNSNEYAAGSASPGHMIVVAGMRSDGNPTGAGTSLYVLDPWPPNVGKRSWVNFFTWMNEVPTRTYRVFERR